MSCMWRSPITGASPPVLGVSAVQMATGIAPLAFQTPPLMNNQKSLVALMGVLSVKPACALTVRDTLFKWTTFAAQIPSAWLYPSRSRFSRVVPPFVYSPPLYPCPRPKIGMAFGEAPGVATCKRTVGARAPEAGERPFPPSKWALPQGITRTVAVEGVCGWVRL